MQKFIKTRCLGNWAPTLDFENSQMYICFIIYKLMEGGVFQWIL